MIKLMADNLKCATYQIPDVAINSDCDYTAYEQMMPFVEYRNERENGPAEWNKNTNTFDEKKVELMTLNGWYSSMGFRHSLFLSTFFCNVIIWLNDITTAKKKYFKCFFFHFSLGNAAKNIGSCFCFLQNRNLIRIDGSGMMEGRKEKRNTT